MALTEKLFHITALGINMAVLLRLTKVAEGIKASTNQFLPIYSKFSFRFLTKWTFGLEIIYFAMMVAAHLLKSLSPKSKTSDSLRRQANALFTTIVLPCGMFISTGFWSIFLIDRELIFPSWLDEVIPVWVNHGMHTFNTLLPLVDLFLVEHTFFTWGSTIYYSALYLGAYMICLFATYFQHGVWLYPIFYKLTVPQATCFCLFLYSVSLVCQFIARQIGTRWGLAVIQTPQKTKSN